MNSDLAKQHLYTGKFLGLLREGQWEYCYRVNATGAAIILAVTPESNVLLVEQYRVPCHARTIELPAGITGDDPQRGAESQAEAARRELLEETGYEAGEIHALMTGPASSGLTSELVTFFLATGLKKVHAGGGIEHEEIVVHETPFATLDEWLVRKSGEGLLIDPKIYAALYFLRRSDAGST